jgi:hypothetical protein
MDEDQSILMRLRRVAMSSRRMLALARKRNREELGEMRVKIELLADTLTQEGVDLSTKDGQKTLMTAAILKLQRPRDESQEDSRDEPQHNQGDTW